MNARISLLTYYMVPGYRFQLSSESRSFIKKCLTDVLIPTYENKLKGWSICFDLLFIDETKEPGETCKVIGGRRNNYDKEYMYVIRLPAAQIYYVEDGRRFHEFCNCFFAAIHEFFQSKKFEIPLEELKAAEARVRANLSPVDGSALTGSSSE